MRTYSCATNDSIGYLALCDTCCDRFDKTLSSKSKEDNGDENGLDHFWCVTHPFSELHAL